MKGLGKIKNVAEDDKKKKMNALSILFFFTALHQLAKWSNVCTNVT